MTDGPTPQELSERIARLEERMKTMQAEYKTDIERLAEDMAKRDTRLWGAAFAVVALLLAGLGVATAIILSRLPPV